MNSLRFLALLWLPVAYGLQAEPVANPKAFQALDVFELEYADDPQVSPDGKHVVYVRRSSDVMGDRTRSNLWTIDLYSGEHRPLFSSTETYTSPRWSPDGGRLAYLSNDSGSMQLFVRWMDTGQTALLTNVPSGPGSISWSPDGEQIAFTQGVPDKGATTAPMPAAPKGAEWATPPIAVDRLVYRIDGQGFLETQYSQIFVVPSQGGTARQLTSGNFNHEGPLSWDADGSALYFSANRNENWDYQPIESELWSVTLEGGALAKLTDRIGPDYAPSVSPKNNYIAYLGHDDEGLSEDTTELYVMNLDGSEPRSLTGDLDRDVNALEWAPDGSGLYFSADDRGLTKLFFQPLEGKRREVTAELGGSTLGRPYTSGSFSVSEKGVVYTRSRPDRPSDLAYLANRQKEATRLTRLNEDLLGHKTLGEVRKLVWNSTHDGLEIEGWLVTPPHFDANKLYPLILEIHGGPHAAYGPHFSAEIQRYAAEGYVTLYCNPRGSTSYGQAFESYIDKNYPSEDYDDLMSGVDAAIAEGFVDSENLFVTGGSGGGALTAWIVGKTDRFRAAVVCKPVINWISFNLTADFSMYFSKYWFGEYPWENMQGHWNRSPLSLVGNVSTPTLLITGESDYRTPISETEQYYQALKILKVDSAMIRIPDASHNIAGRPSHLVAKIENVLYWFNKYRKTEETEAGQTSEP